MKRLKPTQTIGANITSRAFLARHRSSQPDRCLADWSDLNESAIAFPFQTLSPAIVAPPRGLVRELKVKGDN